MFLSCEGGFEGGGGCFVFGQVPLWQNASPVTLRVFPGAVGELGQGESVVTCTVHVHEASATPRLSTPPPTCPYQHSAWDFQQTCEGVKY